MSFNVWNIRPLDNVNDWWVANTDIKEKYWKRMYNDYGLELACTEALIGRRTSRYVLLDYRDTSEETGIDILIDYSICADELQVLAAIEKIRPLIEEKYPHETP